MGKYNVSTAMMNRLPLYMNYLETKKLEGIKIISSATIAKAMGLGEVLVRKELGVVSGKGKPRVGYTVNGLIRDFDKFLYVNKTTKAIVVGAGKLGRALMGFNNKFKKFGVEIIAAFDSDIDKIDNKKIFSMNKMKKFVKDNKVQIGIITVPKECAVEVYEKLIDCHVKGVWNFAPVALKNVKRVLVKHENLALSLAHLNTMLRNKKI